MSLIRVVGRCTVVYVQERKAEEICESRVESLSLVQFVLRGDGGDKQVMCTRDGPCRASVVCVQERQRRQANC